MQNIPFVKIGQGKEMLLFSHANAYHPNCYLQFLNRFAMTHSVICPLHRPLWDVSKPMVKSWQIFADDIIQFCDQESLSELTAIGHSLGAISLWLVKQQRPDLIKNLIMIDPVFLPQNLVRWNKYIPFSFKKRYIPIVKRALGRRDAWNSKEEAKNHFEKILIFKRFQVESLSNFISYGIIEKSNGTCGLSFPREWEARIYAAAYNTWDVMDHLQQDIIVIKAEYSDVISNETWQKIQLKMPKLIYVEMKNVYHMLPMEKPHELSEIISKFL